MAKDVQDVRRTYTGYKKGGIGMERKQTTIRLPAELKEKLQQEAEHERHKKQTTLRVPTELYIELALISAQTGLTVTSLLLVAIWQNILKLRRKWL